MDFDENEPVLIDFSREKMIHAMIFFLRETRYCGKLKLFKLLYFLDFLHFKQTARPVTGLKYYAWEMGPVPRDLFFELNDPGEDLSRCIHIPKNTQDFEFFKMLPRCNFDKRYFSKRELRLMEQLAEIFRDAKANDMTDISHLPNMPWDRTIRTKGENAEIDYLLALDDKVESLSLEEAEQRKKEMQEVESLFGK